MKKIVGLTILAISSLANATKQIDDRLIISQNFYSIRERPLHELYEPDQIKGILQPELCTASWRGYQADWEIVENRLILNNIKKNPCSSGYEEVEASLFFKQDDYPVFAKWYSGEIDLQISETEYIFEDGDEEKRLLGVNYNALVFTFNLGQLTSTEIKPRTERYN